MNLPYVIIGVVRRHVPQRLLYGLMGMRGRGNSSELDPDAAFAALRERLAAMDLQFDGRRVLEFGSGRTARLALRMIAAGAAHVTQVDFDATPLSDPAHRQILEADCRALGLSAADALARISVRRGDFLELPIPTRDNAVDLVLSGAVLEHVRNPAAILALCHAWLRPGGTTYHLVDLRDHNMAFRYPFEMLAYSDDVWRRWFDLSGGFHLNRWRVPDYLNAMARAGFCTMRAGHARIDPEGARAIQGRLDSRFRGLSEDILAVTWLELCGVRCAGEASDDACGSCTS